MQVCQSYWMAPAEGYITAGRRVARYIKCRSIISTERPLTEGYVTAKSASGQMRTTHKGV